MIYTWKALTGASGEKIWRVPHMTMMFYRFKAAICLLLNIEPSQAVWDNPYIYERIIHVTYTDGGVTPGTDSHPTSYWFEAIVTAPGFLRGWWATIYQDSSD